MGTKMINWEGINQKYLWIIIGVVVGVISLAVVSITGRFIQISPQQKESCPFECCINEPNYQDRVCQGNYQCVNRKCVKTSCPYECCPEGEFGAKPCPTDYECQNNKCVPMDSDRDGLTDIEERQFGSNPYVYDTDSDGLNDYQEKLKGTSPINPNTDNDRYNDNVDPNPTTVNSAKIEITINNKDLGLDVFSILSIVAGTINPDAVVFSPKIDYTIKNIGNDYTSFVNFDIILTISNNVVTRESVSLTRVDSNEVITKSYKYDIKLKQVPSLVIDILKQYLQTQKIDWDITIQNLRYEKF